MNELNIKIDDNTMLFYNHIMIYHILILILEKGFTVIVINQKSKKYDNII